MNNRPIWHRYITADTLVPDVLLQHWACTPDATKPTIQLMVIAWSINLSDNKAVLGQFRDGTGWVAKYTNDFEGQYFDTPEDAMLNAEKSYKLLKFLTKHGTQSGSAEA